METASEMAEKEKPMECNADVKPVVNGVKSETEHTGTYERGVGMVVFFLVLMMYTGLLGSQRYTRKTLNGIVKVNCDYSIPQFFKSMLH